MMALGTREAGSGTLIILIFRSRTEVGPTTPGRTGKGPLGADEQDAVAVELLGLFHGIRTRWLEAAFIPGEFEGRFLSVRTEVIGVQASGRRNVSIDWSDSGCLDAEWFTEVQ